MKIKTYFVVTVLTVALFCFFIKIKKTNDSKFASSTDSAALFPSHALKKPHNLSATSVTAARPESPGVVTPVEKNPTSTSNSAQYPVVPERIKYRLEDGYGVAFGDILLGKPTGDMGAEGSTNAPQISRWPTNEIPYVIKSGFPMPDRVQRAIDYFNMNTAVHFVPFQGQDDVLVFESGKGCKSYVGKIGGYQPVLLEDGCGTQEIIHEMMHALGFVHEQCRTDRDRYVKVNWENVAASSKINFDIVPETFMTLVHYGEFDYSSVMLYTPDMFSRSPGLNTMESVSSENIHPVQSGLSSKDLKRVNALFNYWLLY